ncbi:MAG: repeat-like domain [Thermoplasmata archaeon]|jgi:hypothetical protein|nr:repeat-like domain [Thermoplasmata archaeon]
MRFHGVLLVLLLSAGCLGAGGPTHGGGGDQADATRPVFQAVQVNNGGWEPSMATGPDGRQWVTTQEAGPSSTEAIYWSESGLNWTRTKANPPTTAPNSDNEILVLPSGRVLASVINGTGIALDIHYTDDNGTTWESSQGQELKDQDRQWLAHGPKNPDGTYDVYMLWHNLASGAAQHEMFVSTSHDGGATFQPPVPIAPPGSQAWLDLQCSDSGGPAKIVANHETGQVYAVFPTRTSAAGGCGASVTGPFEINVVAATRIWVSTSKDHGATWTPVLAVDDSSSGKIVGAQMPTAALDKAGNLYVAYPESPKSYPDYDGSALAYVWSAPDAAKFSKPVVVSPADAGAKPGSGRILAQIVAGGAGRIAIFSLAGDGNATGALWTPRIDETRDALDATPTFDAFPLATVPAWKGTASALMGACSGALPGTPLGNPAAGFTCNRASDVYGQTLTADCKPAFVWYADKTLDKEKGGTYVAEQTAGPGLC